MNDETHTFDRMDAWRVVNALGDFSRDMDSERADRARYIRDAIKSGVKAFGSVTIPLSDDDRELIRSALSHEYMVEMERDAVASAQSMNDVSKSLR